MIEEILPDTVIAVESRSDLSDVTLFPAEQAALGRSVEKRRLEFTTARACARTALTRLGLPSAPVTTGARGEPQWPSGVVGSITHCDGYRGCAIGRSSEIVTIGIDVEHNAPLPDCILPEVARTEELPWLRHLKHDIPSVCWDRLLFSAKESVYKAWYPLAKRRLGFEDAIVIVDPSACTFCARLLVSGPLVADRPLRGFSGRFLLRDGLVLTAIVLAASPAS